MRRTRFCLAVCGLLGWASAAVAWGPSTHVAVGQVLLDRVGSKSPGPLSFLRSPSLRDIFLRSSIAPDMTLSILAAKKSDKAYDKLLHSQSMAVRMVTDALDNDDPRQLAFALGWTAHIEADRLMSGPGRVVYKDLIGFSGPTKRRVAAMLPEMNKLCMDAVVIRDMEIPMQKPFVDRPLLIRAIGRQTGKHTRTVSWPDEAIAGFLSSFDWSCSTLHGLATAVANNEKAFSDLAAELSEESDDEPFTGFDELVDEVLAHLVSLVPRSHGVDSTGETVSPTPSKSRSDTVASRTARKAGQIASRGLSFLWDGNSVTAKMRQVAIEQSLRVLNSFGGEDSRARRVLTTFVADLINDTRTWSQVKIHVRRIAEAQ